MGNRTSLSDRAESRSSTRTLQRAPRRGATWLLTVSERRAMVCMMSDAHPVDGSACNPLLLPRFKRCGKPCFNRGAGWASWPHAVCNRAQGAVAWLVLRAQHMMRVTGTWLLLRNWNRVESPSRAPPIPVMEIYAMAKQALLDKEADTSILHFSSSPHSSALASRSCLTLSTRSPITSATASWRWHATVQDEGEDENKVGLKFWTRGSGQCHGFETPTEKPLRS